MFYALQQGANVPRSQTEHSYVPLAKLLPLLRLTH